MTTETINPQLKQVGYSFDTSHMPAQQGFMESTAREVLYSGAFGAGKSRAGCEKGLFFSLKYPGNRGLITRKAYTDLRDTTMDTWFRRVLPPHLIRSYNKQEHKVILKNGSEILFIGMDQASKIGSLEVGWIFADETTEFTEEDWSMLLGRLRLPDVPFRQIFGATNPSSPVHWLYKRFFQNGELRKKGTTQVFTSRSTDNKFNPNDYIESLNSLTGKYKQRYVDGMWIGFEGLVYDVYDPTVHLLPRNTTKFGLTGDPLNPIPQSWDRYLSIDFGFTNPFVCQWWASPRWEYYGNPGAQDRRIIPFNNRVWIRYREIYHTGITTPVHAEEIKRLADGPIIAAICDWDAEDRAFLRQSGFKVVQAHKDRVAGVQATHSAIANNNIFFLENSVTVKDNELVGSLPTCTEEEFFGYQHQTTKRSNTSPNEGGVKKNDHGMDALRYMYYTLSHMLGGNSTASVSLKSGVNGTVQVLPQYLNGSANSKNPSLFGIPSTFTRETRSFKRFR